MHNIISSFLDLLSSRISTPALTSRKATKSSHVFLPPCIGWSLRLIHATRVRAILAVM